VRAQGRERDQDVDLCAVLGGPAGPAGHAVQAGQAGGGDGQVWRDGQSGYRDDFLMPPGLLEQMDDVYWHDFLADWASL
jgi:hypothetical protein